MISFWRWLRRTNNCCGRRIYYVGKVQQGTEEALKVLQGILGTAALDVAVEEAKEAGDFDLCDELRGSGGWMNKVEKE